MGGRVNIDHAKGADGALLPPPSSFFSLPFLFATHFPLEMWDRGAAGNKGGQMLLQHLPPARSLPLFFFLLSTLPCGALPAEIFGEAFFFFFFLNWRPQATTSPPSFFSSLFSS